MRRGRRSRLLSVLIILTLLAVSLPLAAEAAVGTSYRRLTQPEVVAGQAEAAALGSLYVRVEPLAAGYHAALVSLPRGWRLEAPGDVHAVETALVTMDIGGTGQANEFKMEINCGATVSAVTFVLPVKAIIPAGASGEVKLAITGLAGQLTSGEAVVGRIGDGKVTVTMTDPPVIGEDGSRDGAVQVTVAENAPGVLRAGDRSLEFILPRGFAWNDANLRLEALQPGGFTTVLQVDPENDRVLRLKVRGTGERTRSTLHPVTGVRPQKLQNSSDAKSRAPF
ncbi:MAG: hypothetical protein AB1441_08015 [Bacillota bacterium]